MGRHLEHHVFKLQEHRQHENIVCQDDLICTVARMKKGTGESTLEEESCWGTKASKQCPFSVGLEQGSTIHSQRA